MTGPQPAIGQYGARLKAHTPEPLQRHLSPTDTQDSPHAFQSVVLVIVYSYHTMYTCIGIYLHLPPKKGQDNPLVPVTL